MQAIDKKHSWPREIFEPHSLFFIIGLAAAVDTQVKWKKHILLIKNTHRHTHVRRIVFSTANKSIWYVNDTNINVYFVMSGPQLGCLKIAWWIRPVAHSPSCGRAYLFDSKYYCDTSCINMALNYSRGRYCRKVLLLWFDCPNHNHFDARGAIGPNCEQNTHTHKHTYKKNSRFSKRKKKGRNFQSHTLTHKNTYKFRLFCFSRYIEGDSC